MSIATIPDPIQLTQGCAPPESAPAIHFPMKDHTKWFVIAYAYLDKFNRKLSGIHYTTLKSEADAYCEMVAKLGGWVKVEEI